MMKKLILNIFKEIKRRVRLKMHLGTKYLCPFCGYNSKTLSRIGLKKAILKKKQVIGAGRRYGGCHKCNASDREKLIFTYLKYEMNFFALSKSKKILHLAPERMLSEIFLSNGFINYVCGDLYTKGYSYPDYVQNINVLNIPFEDNYFDLIICNHLLEHVPEDILAMKELYRVLRKNGKAILQVPISKNSNSTFEDFSVTDPQKRAIIFGQFDHVRIYGQDYPSRLNSVGFKTERINISKKYIKYGLNPYEDIFIGKK